MKNIFLIFLLLKFIFAFSQDKQVISGQVFGEKLGLKAVEISLIGTNRKTETDSLGNYKFEKLAVGNYKIQAWSMGFQTIRKNIVVKENDSLLVNFDLIITPNNLNEVVISGTLKPVRRLESPVPVEVYSPVFFKKNPTPSIYEALQNVNGVRPQLKIGRASCRERVSRSV